MTFISYAQNFEDVMLWRAFMHVENGFYVDIGAQDPLVDSVSLAFYERGWRGVHVEPTQQYSDKLRKARPDETVLQLAIGNQAGTLSFYEFEDTGLSTADVDIAHRHQEAGFRCNQTLVSVISLDTLLERVGVQDIHWLKLDVEGLEKAVLESWKSSSILPWVLVIESTRPLTQEESYGEWEKLVLDKGYQYVYFDGLNRFYVSPHHTDLTRAFSSPPNIFDGFVLSGSASQPFCKLVESKVEQAVANAKQIESAAQQRIESVESAAQQRIESVESAAQQRIESVETITQQQLQQAGDQAINLEVLRQEDKDKFQKLESTLFSIENSLSWKLTLPLRLINANLHQILFFKRKLKDIFGRKFLTLLDVIKLYIIQRPNLKHKAVAILAAFPYFEKKVVALLTKSSNDIEVFSSELMSLTPHAREIYDELKTLRENFSKDGF